MLTEHEEESLLGEVSRAALESLSAEKLGAVIMPMLERLVDASSSVFYRINERGSLIPLAGTLVEAGYRYSRDYYGVDPLQEAMRIENPWLFRTSRSAQAWRAYVDRPVYTELCRFYDIHSYVHLRIVDSEHGAAGMYGIMLSHGERQPEFSARDELNLIRVLPPLVAAVQRSRRLAALNDTGPMLESVMESAQRPTVVLDGQGGYVWASQHAIRLLADAPETPPAIPAKLTEAALTLVGRALRSNASLALTASLKLTGARKKSMVAHLRLTRTQSGAPVVIVELSVPAAGRTSTDLATRFGLTKMQVSVLDALAKGLSDRDVARRHGVSIATVRTHVGQILAKLGVKSRVQAALLAAGLPSEGAELQDPDLDVAEQPPR